MLGWMQKAALGLLVLLFVLVGLVFALNNQVEASLDFLIYRTPVMGLALWLLGALALGALLGVSIGSVAMLRVRLENKQLARRLVKAEKALEAGGSNQAKGV